jgi:sulfotransferase
VYTLVAALLEKMSAGSEFANCFDDERRGSVLRAVFASYYDLDRNAKVVFDTNRIWSARAPMLAQLYQGSRIICCVRDIGWIIDSIERVLRRTPLQTSRLFNYRPGSSVYARVQTLMSTENGLIGMAWSALHEAWFSEDARRLIVVRYESLSHDPVAVLRRLYDELGQPYFDHDVENISYEEPEYDAELGMPGMHTVRRRVSFEAREPCIPPEIFKKYAELSFWSRPNGNPNGVTVI